MVHSRLSGTLSRARLNPKRVRSLAKPSDFLVRQLPIMSAAKEEHFRIAQVDEFVPVKLVEF
jgi:hypothetical protein